MRTPSLAAVLLFGMLASTSTASAATPVNFQDLMRKELDAWSTLDANNAAPFYAQEPGYVFYDLMPLKYDGWAAYAAGVNKLFPGLTSTKFTIHDDVQTHREGKLAWGTATVLVQIVTKAGAHEQLEARWTVIWEKRGKKWLVVHEHLSAPVG